MASDLHALDARTRLLLRILGELERGPCEFALLHGDGERPPDVESDVDLAFATPPPLAIEPILRRLAAEGALAIVQRLHYDVPHGYYYILHVPGDGGSFLHLDCLCDPIGINAYRLPTTYLLEGAARGSYGRRIEARREAVYLLMKRAIKGKLSPVAFDRLRQRASAAGEALWLEVMRWFGPQGLATARALLDAATPAQAATLLPVLASHARRHAWRQQTTLQLRSAWAQTWRKARRFVRPTGLFVVVAGPDGSGKSTITSALLLQLARGFRATSRFHWRPGLLPKLGRTPAAPTAQASAAAPHEGRRYGGLTGYARFVYYWLDFVLGYWLLIYPRKAQSTLIVGERYFADVLVDPQRYGFAISPTLVRLAARFVPAPDLLLVLVDDAQAVFERKRELSPALIASQMTAWRGLAQRHRRAAIIDGGRGATDAAVVAARTVLDLCVERTSLCLDGEGADRWYAFPSRRHVKVWCSHDDTLRNALRLYHPYSMSARLVKALGCQLPREAGRLVFHQQPDAALQRHLTQVAHTIRQELRDPLLSVSFAAGTPGPHRKFTGQVTRDGRVLAYVKLTHDPAVSELLENERAMLQWLHESGFDASAMPARLGFTADASQTLLFLGPPPGLHAHRRGPQVDAQDAGFLLALGKMAASVTPLPDVLAGMHLDRRLETTFATNLPALPLVREAIAAVTRLLGESGVRTSACHGDYAPWNTLALQDGRLFVLDWEYGRRSAAALNDAFHRIFMPARLVYCLRAADVIAQLLALPEHGRLGEVFAASGVAREQLPAYLLLYLLRELARKPGLDEFMAETIRHTLRHIDPASGRPKVLVAAYACEPGAGSEPGVGWNMCQAIARDHEAWVITRANNREKIERALALEPNPNLHFRYTDLPDRALAWKRRSGSIRAYYYLWQFAAWRAARRLTRDIDFDVAHHVTFVNDYTFSFLAFLPVPFVWGPIGSNGRRPGALVERHDRVRDELGPLHFKRLLRCVDPLFWWCAMRASLVVGINRDIGHRFPLSLLARVKFESHPAIGVEGSLLEAAPRRSADGMRVVSMGQLVSIKAFHLTVRAFARLSRSDPDASLVIVGDGELKPALQRLVQQLGIEPRVHFVPFLPRADALALMRDADVFLFPSFEAAGMVVLEAMAQGVPVVALAGTGPGEMIDEACGICVRPGALEETVERLADALLRLSRDAQLRMRMGAAAQRRVRERFLWEERHRAIGTWYSAAGVRTASRSELRQTS